MRLIHSTSSPTKHQTKGAKDATFKSSLASSFPSEPHAAMWLVVALLFLVAVLCAFLVSFWYNLWCRTPVALCAPHCRPMKVGVVLGSGGHTSEMLRTISSIPPSFWDGNRPFYVVSATDVHSSDLAQEQEQRLFQRRAVVYTIPRAREVGQSYVTSVATTLRAAGASLRVILVEKPDVLLTNGPGVCIPVIAAALCISACLPWCYRRPAIVYMESFTCVAHLSLTGRLLAPFVADIFTVHWRSLETEMRRCCRRGTLVYIGCEDSPKDGRKETMPTAANKIFSFSPPPSQGQGQQQEGESYALVTVGSTKFAALVEAMLHPEVCAALKKHFHITKLYVQYGMAALSVPVGATELPTSEKESQTLSSSSLTKVHRQQWICGGLCVEAFAYRPHLDALIRTATLIITHAGAGTILEGLHARRPLVVVPNRQLMSDHQLELAEGLATGGFIFSLQVTELVERLPTLDLSVLRQHQGMDMEELARSLQLVLAGNADNAGKSKAE